MLRRHALADELVMAFIRAVVLSGGQSGQLKVQRLAFVLAGNPDKPYTANFGQSVLSRPLSGSRPVRDVDLADPDCDATTSGLGAARAVQKLDLLRVFRTVVLPA